MGQRHLFRRPYKLKLLVASGAEFDAEDARNLRSGRTLSALNAEESSRTYLPMSCIAIVHRPRYIVSAKRSENRITAASEAAANSFFRMTRCCSTDTVRGGAFTRLNALVYSSFESKQERSCSRLCISKSDFFRCVGRAPQRLTRSLSRRPIGVSTASSWSTHSFMPSWEMVASSMHS